MNAMIPAAATGSGLMPQNLTDAMRLAEMMAKGKMVPEHLRNPADMLMVIEQAVRWGMSPFAVAQCTAVVRGRISYEGKLVSAAINASGVLQGRLDYEFHGVDHTRRVIVRGTMRGEDKPREVTVTLASAKTDNEHWRKSPDQMLTYHGARVWARRHAPEVMLGIYSPEEFVIDPPRAPHPGPTIEAEPEAVAAPEPTPVPKRPTVSQWLDVLALELASCDLASLEEILARDDVQQAQDRLRNGARDRLQHMIGEALRRTAPPHDQSDDLDAFTDPFVDDPREPAHETV